MFQRVIEIDKTSYVEVTTRLIGKDDCVCLTLRTKSADGKVTAIAAILDQPDSEMVVKAITDALASRRDPSALAAMDNDKI